MKILERYLRELSFDDDQKIKIRSNCGCALVIKEGDNGEKLLLTLRRSPTDHWPLAIDLPRGGCDFGGTDRSRKEPILKCVIRECKEETGLDVIPIKFIDKFDYLADEGTRLTTQYNYLCKMKYPEQKVKLSKEHDQFKWISSVGEAEMMLTPELKKTVVKVLSQDNQLIDYPEGELADVKIEE